MVNDMTDRSENVPSARTSIGGGVMGKTTFEWEADQNPEALQGNAKFIVGGIFTRPIQLGSIEDAQYLSEIIENVYKSGYTNGKDRIKHQLANILKQTD